MRSPLEEVGETCPGEAAMEAMTPLRCLLFA